MISCSNTTSEIVPEHVKVTLRSVGHQLLVSINDTTSLVLPVIDLGSSIYELSFEKPLSFDPNNLVSIVDSAFQKSKLTKQYRVEVVHVTNYEIAYSYEMDYDEQNTIIPCGGRLLPKAEYSVKVDFDPGIGSKANWPVVLLLILSFGFGVFYLRKKQKPTPVKIEKAHKELGSFKFYPDQSKLVKQAVEIGLSKKECELLEIFIANPNQIIKRDELTKRVWEDNGVFVGRSLDTYISKLRKKLKEDDTIKLTNVHGIGYKLEILE